jgi:hypothetical protein
VTLPPISFPTLGWQVIDWWEEFLCHGPGDVQGDRWDAPGLGLALDDEEVLFICWLYRVHPADHPRAGRRLVHRAVYSRPKGRRKSEIAGGLMCAEALGPVRCDGFDAAGDPVGVPVTYPFIRCLATEEEQSGNTFDNVAYMLTNGEAANAYAIDVGRSAETSSRIILREPGGGEIVPSTSGSASKDGGKETAATADETHLYVLPGLRSMYRTVARNTGKRRDADPWMLDTTTMYQVGERSVAEQAAEKYAHLPTEECVVKNGVLYDHRQGTEPARFGDDRSLAKAMRAGYGPAAEWMDFTKIVRIVRDAEDPEEEAYRYYLNIPREAADAWMAPLEIAGLLDEFEVKPGSMVALGFDGSENDDHTVLMGCTEAGDLFPVGMWIPGSEDDTSWRLEVDAAVDHMFKHFHVVRMLADPAYWVSELGGWAQKHGTPPGEDRADAKHKQRVREFWTGGKSEATMAFATGTCRTALRHGAKLKPTPLLTPPVRVNDRNQFTTAQTDDGKPLIQWHFINARKRKIRVQRDDGRTEDAYLVRKNRKGSALKIDGVTSSILARRARDDALKDGLFVPKPVYRRASWR